MTNAGFNNIAAADTLPLQFTARTNASVLDQTNVIAWLTTQLASTEVGNCSVSNSVQPFPGSGVTSLTITSSDCGTLLPNRPYTLTEHLVYDPTQAAPNFVTTAFYTQAKDPVAINPATNITHCSATLSFQNAAASPANPQDTTYSVNVGGAVSSGSAIQTKIIGGTGVFGDQNSVIYTNLQAGTAYTPTVTATNRGGGAWRNSNTVSYTGFPTVAWGGAFSVTPASIGSTSANFVAAGVDTTGVQTWQIQTTPVVAGLPSGTATDLNGTHTMTGLTPNTQYQIQIRITESGGCFSVLPLAPINVTMTPTAPSVFNLVPAAAGTLSASWTVGPGNPGNTTYQIQYCLNAGFSSGCATKNVPGNGSSTNLTGLTEETVYFGRVKALTIGGGLDSSYSNSASAQTINIAPVVPVPSCTQIGVTNTANCTVSGVVDNDLGNAVGVLYQWDLVTPVAGTSFSPASTPNSVSNTNSTTFSYPSAQSFDVRVTVIDHNSSGASTSNHVLFNPGQIPTTITVAPSAATIATGQSTAPGFFAATVKDQNGVTMVGQPVNWTVNGAGNMATPASGPSTTFTAGLVTGPFTLHADLPGATGGTANITIVSAGPIFDSFVFTMSSTTHKGGTAVVASVDNATPNWTHAWTASDPAITFTPSSATGSPMTTAVTFPLAGQYTLTDTITDSLGAIASSSTVVTVDPILSGIKVCAVGDASCSTKITVKSLQDQQFKATGLDQFGNLKDLPTGSVVWNGANGTGASASFSSSAIGQTVRVTATSGGATGFVDVNIISLDVSGAVAYPVPYKASFGTGVIYFSDLGTQAKIRIFTPSGRKVFEKEVDNCADQKHCFAWDIKNSSGENLASGVYFYMIESPEGKKDGKLIIIK